jgi:hypothetical protein
MISGYTISNGTVGRTPSVTLYNLMVAAEIGKGGVRLIDGEMPSSEERARIAAINTVINAFHGGSQAEKGPRSAPGRIPASSHERQEDKIALSSDPSLDATMSADVIATRSEVDSCNGRDEVSTFFSHEKLRYLTSRNSIGVHRDQKSVWVKMDILGTRETNLPERSMTCRKEILYISKPVIWMIKASYCRARLLIVGRTTGIREQTRRRRLRRGIPRKAQLMELIPIWEARTTNHAVVGS